jgi:transcriptional regulator with XRE-family HTH domain
MTIKEIAELCGVDRRTIERWAHKVSNDPGQNAQGLAEKLEQAKKSGKDPADFTLEETLAVIGEGSGNKTLAVLLAENASNKNALIRIEKTKAGIEQYLTEYKALVQETINNVLPGSEISSVKRLYARYDLTTGGRVYVIKAGGNIHELLFYDRAGTLCARTTTKALKSVPLATVIQLKSHPELGKCARYSGILEKWMPLEEAGEMGRPEEVLPNDYLVWREELRKKEAPALEGGPAVRFLSGPNK